MEALTSLLFGKYEDHLLEMKRIEKILPDEQIEATNKLLCELLSKLSLNRKVAVSLSKLASRADKDLKDARDNLAKDLCIKSNLAFEPEGFKVHELMISDLEVQMLMVEAQKSVLQAKGLMENLIKITTEHLFVLKISFDKELWSETYASLKDEYEKLKGAADLTTLLRNGLSTSNDLLTSIIRRTTDLEQEMGFSMPGMCSPETKALYHHALAHQLKGRNRKEDENILVCKMFAFVGHKDERNRQIALLDAKEQALKAELQKERLPLLKQLKERLEQKDLEKEADQYSPEFADAPLSNDTFDCYLHLGVLLLMLAIAFYIRFG